MPPKPSLVSRRRSLVSCRSRPARAAVGCQAFATQALHIAGVRSFQISAVSINIAPAPKRGERDLAAGGEPRSRP